jgi:hypothetical protein
MNYDDIGTNITRTQFCDYLNSVKGGQFFHVRGYVNAEGEKSDHFLRFGIKYGSLKNRDIQHVNDALNGKTKFSVKVIHGVWIPQNMLNLEAMESMDMNAVPCTASFMQTINGTAVKIELSGRFALDNDKIFTSHKAKDRIQVTLSYNVESTSEYAKIALQSLMQSLVAPRPAAVEYDKEAKSCYSYEKEGETSKWYLRDVLAVYKTVRVQGNYPFSASSPAVAIKKAIAKKELLTNKYRQFILTDGQFESITIEGQAVLVDGITEDFFMALPEHVKEAETVEAQAI